MGLLRGLVQVPLGHPRLTQAEPGHQLVHRPLALPQQVEDVPAVRLGEHLER
jgi:hypothetical protein